MDKTRTLLDGLNFGEGPRWHEGRLWFSDFDKRAVMTVNTARRTQTIVEVPGQPSGLGWLPDGRLLVVSMKDRRLLRLEPSGLVEVADLHGLAAWHCNDMVVDERGNAYVGNFGFDLDTGQFAPAAVILVTPDGSARIAAADMAFPNGSVITPDGRTIIIAETWGNRLTAFDIAPNGDLTGRRIWAPTGTARPDGICLDAEGAVWVAAPGSHGVFRFREGGEITDKVEVATQAYACMLGGPDRRTLFILTSETAADGSRSGRVETIRVEVPGAGLP